MSEQIETPPTGSRANESKSTGLVWLLVALVGIEALAVVGAFVWLIIELASSKPESFRTAVALTVLVGVIAAWLVATTIGLIRRVRWARGSAITWQVLQLAVAFGATQGDRPNWSITLALLVPVIAVVVLALSPSVRAQFGAADG